MAKIVMYYPQFGWFDGAHTLSMSEFHPNAADPTHSGVSVVYDFQNNTSKTIKYIGIVFKAYNRVGDQVGKDDGCKTTGPIAPHEWKYNVIAHNLWRNHTIASVKVSHILVDYMDGTKERIEANEIEFRTKPAPAPAATTGSGGCYVATAVYGSYDCPEVWTLRRFRDNHLAKTLKGRAFIRTYYAISPTLVKWFGETEWFKKFWKKHLDRMINELQKEGYENTPYDDKEW